MGLHKSMHKLIDYICDELEELERKADKEGKLSMAEIQYGDMLAHFKKNLLKGEEMYGDEEMYSMAGGSYAMGDDRGGMNGRTRMGGRSMRGGNSYRYEGEGSYARGRGRNARRDSMGRYSRDDDFKGMLEDAMEEAPNDSIRQQLRSMLQMM